MGVTCQLLLSAFTRLVCLAFLVLAGLSIPESLKFLYVSIDRQGSSLTVPLLVCEPSSLDFKGTNGTVSLDTVVDGITCHNQESLIWAVILSLSFSMAAIVFFFVFGIMAECQKGPFNKSSVLGMGLFLIFILVQTAACTWALAQEADYWKNYFQTLFQNDPSYGITQVSLYGSATLLQSAGGVAIGTAACLLLDSVVTACCTKSRKDEAGHGTDATTSEQPSKEAAPSDAVSSTDQQSTYSWTDY